MKYILAWVVATSLMTGFSYLFYYITKKEAREPFLLNYILVNKFPDVLPFKSHASMGWILHYILGIVFLLLNILLINVFDVDASILWGLPFGVFAGVLGLIGWNILFNIAGQLPEINFIIYYLQLLVAHIVFCVSAIAIHNLNL